MVLSRQVPLIGFNLVQNHRSLLLLFSTTHPLVFTEAITMDSDDTSNLLYTHFVVRTKDRLVFKVYLQLAIEKTRLKVG